MKIQKCSCGISPKMEIHVSIYGTKYFVLVCHDCSREVKSMDAMQATDQWNTLQKIREGAQ